MTDEGTLSWVMIERDRLAAMREMGQPPVRRIGQGGICGAWGGCDLPSGHNEGQADIPERHRSRLA